MTTLNGLVGMYFNLAVIVASSSLSSKRAFLIHQFDDGTELSNARPCTSAKSAAAPAGSAELRKPLVRILRAAVRHAADLLIGYTEFRTDLPGGRTPLLLIRKRPHATSVGQVSEPG
jgi:hypothetical protein